MLTTKWYLIYRSIHIIPIVTSHVQSHIRSLDAYKEIDLRNWLTEKSTETQRT